jgi:exosortase A-associated hydrolase 1
MQVEAAVHEEILRFECAGHALWGVLSRPGPGEATADTAVVIVVGGPQYRVGSHRQFVRLARALAAGGYPTLRFDMRGMGDSGGPPQTFESAGPDIRAALDVLARACPDTRRLVVWGLCDAASAALMFAGQDPRVAGIVAANPWSRSTASLAAAHVKHYYGARLRQREFWSKLWRGEVAWRTSAAALMRNLTGARALRRGAAVHGNTLAFQEGMARGLQALRGSMLLILSGNDLTAQEFLQYAAASPGWQGLLDDPKVQRVDIPEADHTFSSRSWFERVEQETLRWLQRLPAANDMSAKADGSISA